MISNIPTAEDFYKTGNELLSLSWDLVAGLLVELNEAEYYGLNPEEIKDKYWNLSQRKLSTSLAIVQQGTEFLIKGRIAEISPFLLISEPPSKWASTNENNEIDFSEFRTIDAQDLIKVHNTVADDQFNDDFNRKFNALRKKRNVIMHSIDTSLEIQVKEIIESLLFIHKTFFPEKSWGKVRKQFLEKAPESELGSLEYLTNAICRELSLIFNILPPASIKKYFNVNKSRREYFCPVCLDEANKDADFEYKLARLTSRDPDCTSLYCPVCDVEHVVSRNQCPQNDCLGNVISDENVCLTCEKWY